MIAKSDDLNTNLTPEACARRITSPFPFGSQGQVGTKPATLRVYVVCTNPENGEYIAFQENAPDRKVTACSRDAAIAEFISRFVPSIEITDVQP